MRQPNRDFVAAWLACGAGAVTALGVYLQPDQLHTSAWVGYLASAVFALGGLALFARGLQWGAVYRWTIVALLVAMAVVANWIAFGPGPRSCSAPIGLAWLLGPGALCRFAFGLGGFLVAAMAAWAVRMAYTGRSAR